MMVVQRRQSGGDLAVGLRGARSSDAQETGRAVEAANLAESYGAASPPRRPYLLAIQNQTVIHNQSAMAMRGNDGLQ